MKSHRHFPPEWLLGRSYCWRQQLQEIPGYHHRYQHHHQTHQYMEAKQQWDPPAVQSHRKETRL